MNLSKVLFLSTAVVFTTTMSFAQDVKEIIAKHNDAVGGAEKWKNVKSVKKTGKMNIQGMDIPFSQVILKDKGMRQDLEIMGANNYVILTPTAGWSFMPIQGQAKPEPMPAEGLKDIADQLDFKDDLMSAHANNEPLELVGKEELAGAKVFKLKGQPKDAEPVYYYVNEGNWLLVRVSTIVKAQGQEMEITKDFSDYKKLDYGITVAMKEEAGDAGSYTFDKIEINQPVDEKIFQP
jgi:hypothetical protein